MGNGTIEQNRGVVPFFLLRQRTLIPLPLDGGLDDVPVSRSTFGDIIIYKLALPFFCKQYSNFEILSKPLNIFPTIIMASTTIPSEPPPSYEQATGVHTGPESATFSRQERNGIPLRARRSMEDELRPLPPGWVRTYDPATQHQFFVDTRADPPRSIWHHPYDDDQFLATLSADERDNIHAPTRQPSEHDIAAESTDEEGDHHTATHAPVPPRRLGRRLKDKLTGMTHEERAAERARREREERQSYEQHMLFRQGLRDAETTGRPHRIGTDGNGDDLYLEPSWKTFPGVTSTRRLGPYLTEVQYRQGQEPGPPGRYLRPNGGDVYGYGYNNSGRYPAPAMAYGRPYGRGYGGGLGFPMITPILGGVMLGGLTTSMMM